MRHLALILALVLAISMVLSGCGSDNASGESAGITAKDSAGTASAQETKTDKSAKIKFMHWWSYVTEDILQPFKDENPNVSVEMDYTAPDQYANKIKLLSSTGELPDVFAAQGPYLADFTKQGLTMDLTDILKTNAYDKEKPWGETIQKSLMENVRTLYDASLQKSGKDFGVPFGAISVVVVYNKAIFEKVGITAPKTWDEFMSNNTKLKEAGYIPFSFTEKVGWGEWWLNVLMDQTLRDVYAADWEAGTVSYTDPRFVEVLSTIQDMWKKGYFDPGGFTNGIEESQALFVQGKMPQFFTVPENFVTYLIENSPKDAELDAYVMPAFKGIEPSRSLGGAPNVLCISADTKATEASVTFAKYMVSEKIFKLLAPQNVVPSIEGYTPPAGNEIMKAFTDASAGGFIIPHTPTDSGSKLADKMAKDIYPKLLLQGVSAEQCAKEMQDFYEKEVKNK